MIIDTGSSIIILCMKDLNNLLKIINSLKGNNCRYS